MKLDVRLKIFCLNSLVDLFKCSVLSLAFWLSLLMFRFLLRNLVKQSIIISKSIYPKPNSCHPSQTSCFPYSWDLHLSPSQYADIDIKDHFSSSLSLPIFSQYPRPEYLFTAIFVFFALFQSLPTYLFRLLDVTPGVNVESSLSSLSFLIWLIQNTVAGLMSL